MGPTFDFKEFPALGSERLELREFEARLAPDILVFRGDEEVQRYNSVPHKTVQETLDFIEHERERYRQKQEVIWAIWLRECERIVGTVSIFDWDRYHRRANIGYDLARSCWGQGIMSEAVRHVLRFGYERMSLNRIEISTSAANQRSLRLADRLGFTREGSLRKRILEDDGQFYDCIVFGLLREEWNRRSQVQ